MADGTNQHGAIKGDHAGHAVAHRYVLDQGLPNLFPQNGNFNTSAYKKMENELAALVSAGHQVDGGITLVSPADGLRPTEVNVQYHSDGLPEDRNANSENKAGQQFSRAPIK